MDLASQILSDITVYMKYAKYLEDKNRRETWHELVTRNMRMHIKKYPELKNEIERIKHYKPHLEKFIDKYQNIIIIGNGGSNSVASHISQDYTKQLDERCISFSDPSRLTCYINDYGRDMAYVEFLKDFADKDTLVILISSSGNSMNIVNSAIYCKDSSIPIILLSGFDEDINITNVSLSAKSFKNSTYAISLP